MKNKKLIMDGDKIRFCATNIAKMSYWECHKEFFSYKELADSLDIKQTLIDSYHTTLALVQLILVILIFPIMPFIQCFVQRDKAQRWVAEHDDMP